MIYHSNVEIVADFPEFSQDVIRKEVSQARVPKEIAESGGPAHKAFVNALPQDWQNDPAVEIFSRLLFLKEGWYPLTPHFHFDWGHQNQNSKVETLMVCLGDASLTEFITGRLEAPDPEPTSERRQRVDWQTMVDEGISNGQLQSWRIQPGKMILFDNQTLHRARPASKTGWRLLLRAIRGLPQEDSATSPTNKIVNRFSTCRNGYVPETEVEKARYRLYQDS